MEDTNKDGSNDTSTNHLGRKAEAFQNMTGVYVHHYWYNDITITDSYGLNVCFDVLIQTQQWGHEMQWNIKGLQTSTSCESDQVYENGQTYVQRCCLPTRETEFQLTCIDTFGDGWHGANFQIIGKHGSFGQPYCQNFKGDQMSVMVPNPAKKDCENGKNTKLYLSFELYLCRCSPIPSFLSSFNFEYRRKLSIKL